MKKLLSAIFWTVFTALPASADNTVNISNIESKKEQIGATAQISVEFPIGADNPTRRSIIDYIYENLRTMGSISVLREEGPLPPADKDVQFPSNNCDETTFRTFLDQLTTVVCKLTSGDQQEYAHSLEEDGESYQVKWFNN